MEPSNGYWDGFPNYAIFHIWLSEIMSLLVSKQKKVPKEELIQQTNK